MSIKLNKDTYLARKEGVSEKPTCNLRLSELIHIS